MHGYLFQGKNSPYMPLLSPYTIILFWQKPLKSKFFAQNRYKNTHFLLPYMVIWAYMII